MKKDVSCLLALLEKAVEKACEKKVGAVFSSGIDSTVISVLASKYSDETAYSVGTKDSEDLKYVRKAMQDLPFNITVLEVSDEDVEEILPSLVKVVGNPDSLKVSVGVPLYFAAMEAEKDGLGVMLSGQGGDELFGGYNRYLKLAAAGAESLRTAMQKDVDSAYIDNLDRDIAICGHFGIDLRFPYMDEAFGKYASGLPTDFKVHELKEGEEEIFSCVDEYEGKRFIRKYLLRHLAAEAGVPKYILNRKKKAAQYGSGSEKAVMRLARKNGFKDKATQAGRADFVRMYLETLL